MIEVPDKRIIRYNVLSKIKIRPTADDDYAEYSCEARHEALPSVMPLRATVHLSVLCKFSYDISIISVHIDSRGFFNENIFIIIYQGEGVCFLSENKSSCNYNTCDFPKTVQNII